MHIGLRLGRRPSGGMATFVRRLGSALSELEGCRVTYLCMGEPWPDLEGEQVAFGATRQLDEYRLDARRIGQWCKENRVDALVCPGNQASRTAGRTIWWPLTVAPFEQLALAAVAEGSAGKIRWQAIRRSLSLSSRMADGLVFSSNYAQALYGAAIETVAAKPSTVLAPTTSIPVHERKANVDQPYLLSVSNFNRYKFAVEMVDAFAQSGCREQGWSFKLAGRFPQADYEDQVRAAINRHDLTDRVLLLGEKSADQLAELYTEASGFIFASVSENAASYTVIDALAYGLPTVSSFYSSTPEVLGNAVRYADPFSSSELAQNVSALVDPTEAARLEAAALDRASQFPTWHSIAADLVQFVDAHL